MPHLVVVAALLASACAGDLPPASRVDKLRVLAVRAEPPELAPGQAATLDALVVGARARDGDGGTPAVSYLWLACTEPATTGATAACGVGGLGGRLPDGFTPGQDAGGDALPDCARDPGAPLCQIGTGAIVHYAPPADIGGATASSRQVVLTLIAADDEAGAVGCAVGARERGGAPPDPDHCVIALKRLTVSHAEPPNRNPALEAFTLDGESLAAGAGFRLASSATDWDWNAAPTLRVTRAAGASEVQPDGRHEPLLAEWFATAGTIENFRSSFQPADCDDACQRRDPDLGSTNRWRPPTADEASRLAPGGAVGFWVVVRDGRGGVAWLAGRGTQP